MNHSMRRAWHIFFPTHWAVLLGLLLLSPTNVRAAHFQETQLRETQRPNILLIMIDDLGWMDLACQGNKRLHTPNIDRLAKQGMRFTDAYAAAPVCSPTRAAVLTGKSPARLHLTTHIPDRFVPKNPTLLPAKTLDWLPTEHVTIAERLKAVGYRTAFFGKWHLAGGRGRVPQGLGKLEFYPEQQGFDVNIGGCCYGGPPTYFDPYGIHNIAPRKKGEYLTDRLADETIAFIRKHSIRTNRDKPFFVMLWNYTVHWPMEAKADVLKKYIGREGPGLKDVRYGAMIECLDQAMGRIFTALDDMKLSDNTLVIFTSDNGGFSGVADNRPLRAGKGYLYEGGIRVPLIIRQPGVVKPGTICKTPVTSMDFFPTILDAVGLKPDPSVPADGESLAPLLQQNSTLTRSSLYFHYPNYAWHKDNRLGGAIRKGNFKLIEYFDTGEVELYNLAGDLSETKNLAATMPEKAVELQRELAAWRKSSGALMPTKSAR